MIPAGSVLLTSRATVGVAAINAIPVVTNQGFQNLLAKEGTDGLWLYYYASFMRPHLERRAAGSTFLEVSRDSVRSLPILFPPLSEQRAIAAILDAIDEAIGRTNEIVAATEMLRETMLAELLTRGIPGWHTQWRCVPGFGNIPLDWKMTRLDEAAEIVGGSTPSRADLDYWGGATPWVIPWPELTALTGRYLTTSREAITDKGLKAAGLKVIPAGSVLMTSRATIGSTAINTVPVTTNQGFQNLVPKPGCHSLWLYYCISSMQNELRRRASGSTFLEISGDSVRNLPVLLPRLDEQQAIADALDSVDTRMEEARTERGALELLKASTTEALLTGSVRV